MNSPNSPSEFAVDMSAPSRDSSLKDVRLTGPDMSVEPAAFAESSCTVRRPKALMASLHEQYQSGGRLREAAVSSVKTVGAFLVTRQFGLCQHAEVILIYKDVRYPLPLRRSHAAACAHVRRCARRIRRRASTTWTSSTAWAHRSTAR